MWGKKVSQVFESLESHLSFFYRIFGWIPVVVGGSVSVFTAKLAGLWKAYEPFSYFILFVLGALVVVIVLVLYGWAKHRLALAGYVNELSKPAISVNPLDTTYHKKRIVLSDLADPYSKYIEGKTFVDCELVGDNKSFLFSGSTVIPPLGIYACDFITVPSSEVVTNNAYFVIDCDFKNCKLYHLTMLMNHNSAMELYSNVEKSRPFWVVPPTSVKTNMRE